MQESEIVTLQDLQARLLPGWAEDLDATGRDLREVWPFDPPNGGKVRHRILPDLWPLAVPLAGLRPLPGNPRKGDVRAMQRSLMTYGQRKPVVVNVESDQPTVEAGNHTLAAAKQEHWTHLAIARVRDDPSTETGYALADNRLGQLGSFDLDLLADATSRLEAADPALLLASGYDDAAARHILLGAGRIDAPDPREEWVGMPEYANEDLQVEWVVRIAFLTKDDARAFFRLIDRPLARKMMWPEQDRQGQFSGEAYSAVEPGEEGSDDAAQA